MSFPGGSDGRESACNAGGLGWIPGLGRSPGGGHGNPLKCSCLENPVVSGGLQSMGSQRVGHDQVLSTAQRCSANNSVRVWSPEQRFQLKI